MGIGKGEGEGGERVIDGIGEQGGEKMVRMRIRFFNFFLFIFFCHFHKIKLGYYYSHIFFYLSRTLVNFCS